MTEVSQFLIYGLRDPRTGEIRYVGLSRRGMQGPLRHTRPHELAKTSTPKQRWVRELVYTHGTTPEIVVLQQLPAEDGLCDAERIWIAHGMSALGLRFLNIKPGGEGLIKREFTPEYRAKLSAKAKARDNTANLEKMWAASRGRKPTAEERAKHSAALKGRPRSPEHSAKVQAGRAAYIAANGGLHDAEARRKIGEKSRGRKDSPETAERRRLAQKARREREAAEKELHVVLQRGDPPPA